MRKHLLTLFSLSGFVVLTACTPAGGGSTESAEAVLQKAATAHQTLASANYEGDVTLRVERQDTDDYIDGSATLNGRMQSAGKQSAVDAAFEIEGVAGAAPFEADGHVEFIVATEEEAYFLLHDIDVSPENTFLNNATVNTMLGQWWSIPLGETGETENITMDPRLLRAQTEVVVVTKDHGTDTIDGHTVYEYDVKVDPDRLYAYLEETEESDVSLEEVRAALQGTQMTGTIWIDAEQYYIRRAEWHIVREASEAEPQRAEVDFSLTVRDHNEAEPISPPQGAKPFSPFDLMMQMQGGAGMNIQGAEALEGLSEAQRQQLLQNVLDGSSASLLAQ